MSSLRPGQRECVIENDSSSTWKDQPVLNPPRIRHEVERETCTTTPENSGLGNSAVVPTVKSYGAFAKRALNGTLPTSTSTFIVARADGQGGRVTAFEPLSLSVGRAAIIASPNMKRQKISGAGFKGFRLSMSWGTQNRRVMIALYGATTLQTASLEFKSCPRED